MKSVTDDQVFLLGGDFNFAVNEWLDWNRPEPHPSSAQQLWTALESAGLVDIWHHFHTDMRQYTCLKMTTGRIALARLDCLYITEHCLPVLHGSCIILSKLLDHSPWTAT